MCKCPSTPRASTAGMTRRSRSRSSGCASRWRRQYADLGIQTVYLAASIENVPLELAGLSEHFSPGFPTRLDQQPERPRVPLQSCLQFRDTRVALDQSVQQPGYVALCVRIMRQVAPAAGFLVDVVESARKPPGRLVCEGAEVSGFLRLLDI